MHQTYKYLNLKSKKLFTQKHFQGLIGDKFAVKT